MTMDSPDTETWKAIVTIAKRMKCGHRACKDLRRAILRVEERTRDREKTVAE